MGNSNQLVTCPECKIKVRSKRLQKHLKKAHRIHRKIKNFSSHLNNRKIKKASSNLDVNFFKDVEHYVKSWLRRRKFYLHNINNIQCLTIMILNQFMGYNFDEIKKISQYKISKNVYQKYCERLRFSYDQIIYVLPNRWSSSNIYLSKNEHIDGEADWHGFNTVDRGNLHNKKTNHLRVNRGRSQCLRIPNKKNRKKQ